MSDVFISYARSAAEQAQAVAKALRELGYSVWLDDELPAHRAYAEVIEERLRAAKAVVVVWSGEAVNSRWVCAEADVAHEAGTLVQLSLDGAVPPLPFNRIQCADMKGWSGEVDAPGWRKVVASVADLVGGAGLPVAGTAGAPPPLPSKPSIAVLPFANLSGDPEQDYFADGMVEEITRALSRFKSLFVIGAGSGLSFKGKGVTPQEAASTLGVRYALEGSVRKAGARVRIAVKLIDATDGAQIWADRFEDTLEDVFALQDRVALAVAGVIEPAVREAEIRRALARPTENRSSYDLYLRALAKMRLVGRDGYLAALEFLDRAIALDPDFGLALAVAASCHAMIFVYRWSDDLQGHASDAQSLIERALKVAGDDPEVLSRLAIAMNMVRGDMDTASALGQRAMSLNPGSSYVLFVAGLFELLSGRPQPALEQFETALRLDPLSETTRPSLLCFLGMARCALGQFREAVPLLKQSAQLRPDWPMPLGMLAAAYGHLGETGASREVIARHGTLTDVEISDWATHWATGWGTDLGDLIRLGVALGAAGQP